MQTWYVLYKSNGDWVASSMNRAEVKDWQKDFPGSVIEQVKAPSETDHQ